ncbi:MAG TPA: chaperone modulator CbpM [Paenirhodobacter sp.]
MTEADILTRIDRLTHDRLTVCVTRSWVRPRHADSGAIYDETDLARLRLIVELTEDMAVNDEALPLILNLIDEVSTLRRGMRTVDGALRAEGLADRLVARISARLNDLNDTDGYPRDGRA